MLNFASSFLAWLGSTALPAFVGLVIISSAARFVKPRFIAAFALGIFLWFFADTIGGSSNLDVNAGFAGGVTQLAILVLFVVGLVLFFAVDRTMFSRLPGSGEMDFRIPMLVALALGIHGFGEGTALGSTAVSTSSTSLLAAFGGIDAGVAYVLHKALEPMMIGACYVVYSQQGRNSLQRLKDLLVLTALFVIPSLVGAATGYYINYDATYFFALGTGTSIYAAFKLIGPQFRQSDATTSGESLKVALWLLFGFLCIYIAALFHS